MTEIIVNVKRKWIGGCFVCTSYKLIMLMIFSVYKIQCIEEKMMKALKKSVVKNLTSQCFEKKEEAIRVRFQIPPQHSYATLSVCCVYPLDFKFPKEKRSWSVDKVCRSWVPLNLLLILNGTQSKDFSTFGALIIFNVSYSYGI